jgi:hypothetical protein
MAAAAQAMRRRAAALRLFDRWQARQPVAMEPAVAIAAIGWIWQLLPAPSRQRDPDPRGIERMQKLLAVLR